MLKECRKEYRGIIGRAKDIGPSRLLTPIRTERSCRDEGCYELAQYLCRLDFVLADMMGMELVRTTTIAEGCERCDFRYRRKKA